MRAQHVLFAVGFMAIVAVNRAQDISALLKNQGYVEGEIKCVLSNSGAGCDAVGKQLRQSLPEVLRNNCKNCNSTQKRNAEKLVSFMRQRYPNEWQMIVQRYTGRQG